MGKRGKKYKNAAEAIDSTAEYSLDEAVELLHDVSYANFDEAADVAVRLNVDPSHADQMVRGSVVLPHGSGKDTTVLVFAEGNKADEAEEAGADYVGSDDFIERIEEEGWVDFDVAVATPDLMGKVGRIGRILGPRGLMPNPKSGTVTNDVTQIIEELKAGRIEFRVDKNGVIHTTFGRASFTGDQLKENLQALIRILARKRPASAKAPYFKSINISTTMSPGIKVDPGFARAHF